jgi:DNA gyrase subunit A
VAESEDLIITCKSGITIRMKVADISEQGRATQGVKLIRIDEGDEIAAITQIDVDEVAEQLEEAAAESAVIESDTTLSGANSSEEENTVQS